MTAENARSAPQPAAPMPETDDSLSDYLMTTDAKFYPEEANTLMKMAADKLKAGESFTITTGAAPMPDAVGVERLSAQSVQRADLIVDDLVEHCLIGHCDHFLAGSASYHIAKALHLYDKQLATQPAADSHASAMPAIDTLNRFAKWAMKQTPETIEAIMAADSHAGKEQWRHKKRGTIYTVIGRGVLQSRFEVADEINVVIYQGEDGQFWVRSVAEFEDGRFEKVESAKLMDSHTGGEIRSASIWAGMIVRRCMGFDELCGLIEDIQQNAIASAQSPAAIRGDWQPIETDPRDKSRRLLCWQAEEGIPEHVELGWFADDEYRNTYGKSFVGDPDYWMPLPSAPQQAVKPEGKTE